MEISWDVPTGLNGPPPVYHVERTDVSFSDAQVQVVRGRRFTGTGYFRFPSSTLPVNMDFTGMRPCPKSALKLSFEVLELIMIYSSQNAPLDQAVFQTETYCYCFYCCVNSSMFVEHNSNMMKLVMRPLICAHSSHKLVM